MKIYFDMDGTIADLYGVENWLEYLMAEQAYPYIMAKPLINMNVFAKYIHKLQGMGYEVGIISWLSRNCSTEYGEKITRAKEKWLHTHLKSVAFDEIHIIEYGTCKSTCGQGILFDDEERNRLEWIGTAYTAENILNTLKGIIYNG